MPSSERSIASDEPYEPVAVHYLGAQAVAASKRHNYVFIAVGSEIRVYCPAYPRQTFPENPRIVLNPPRSTNLGGFIDQLSPHDINSLTIGELGHEEVLVSAHDDGDVCVYYTGDLRRMAMGENVGKSAWGVALHKERRLLAVSSNTHVIKVFELGVENGEAGRARGKGGGRAVRELVGHRNNIPNISFLDDASGRWLVGTSINGNVILWDVDEGRMVEGCKMGSQQCGWSVAFLKPQAFKPVRNLFDATGKHRWSLDSWETGHFRRRQGSGRNRDGPPRVPVSDVRNILGEDYSANLPRGVQGTLAWDITPETVTLQALAAQFALRGITSMDQLRSFGVYSPDSDDDEGPWDGDDDPQDINVYLDPLVDSDSDEDDPASPPLLLPSPPPPPPPLVGAGEAPPPRPPAQVSTEEYLVPHDQVLNLHHDLSSGDEEEDEDLSDPPEFDSQSQSSSSATSSSSHLHSHSHSHPHTQPQPHLHPHTRPHPYHHASKRPPTCFVFATSQDTAYLLPVSTPHFTPIAISRRFLHQPSPPPNLQNNFVPDRANMLHFIPELSLVVCGSQIGRIGLFRLTRVGGTFAMRLDTVLPREQRDHRSAAPGEMGEIDAGVDVDVRPDTVLLGLAVGPVQGRMQGDRGREDGWRGAEVGRRWRILAVWVGGSVMAWEVGRKEGIGVGAGTEGGGFVMV